VSDDKQLGDAIKATTGIVVAAVFVVAFIFWKFT
jgi:hypothetical protein